MTGFYYFITSVIAGLISNAITIYFQKVHKMDLGIMVLVGYFVLMVFMGFFAFKHYRKMSSKIKDMEEITALNKIKNLHSILYRYAADPNVLKIIDRNGKEYIGGHAGNFYWREVADAICNGMDLKHLRYSNLGSEYFLQNIENGNKIEIPTNNKLEEKIENQGPKNGQILLITESTQ